MKKQDSQPQPTTHSCQVFLSKKLIWMQKSNALLEIFQALKATLWKYAVLGLQWQQWQRPSNHHHHPPPWPAELSTLEFNVPSSVTQPAIMAQLRPTKAHRKLMGNWWETETQIEQYVFSDLGIIWNHETYGKPYGKPSWSNKYHRVPQRFLRNQAPLAGPLDPETGGVGDERIRLKVIKLNGEKNYRKPMETL